MGQLHKSWPNTAAVKTRRNFLARLEAVVILAAAFSFSYAAQALNIGEVVSQSRIGEPLRTQIELTGSGIEDVENACLSLVAPDPGEENASDFVTAAKLTVKTEEKRQFVVISSHRPYNDPFIRIKLQVRCAGVGNIVKSFTILPDFVEVLPIAAPGVAGKTGSVAASSSPGAGRSGMASAASPSAEQDVLPKRRQTRPRRSKYRYSTAVAQNISGEVGQHAPASSSPYARAAPGNQGKTESFRLRLSGESIDESRIGKISQEERSLLLARQKMLDADDQMASFLALQHQVKQLQAELSMVKLKLGQLGVSSPTVSPSVADIQPATTQVAQVATTQEIQPQQPPQTPGVTLQPAEVKPEDVQNQQAQNLQPVKQRKPKIQRGPIIFGLLALLGLLLGLRYYMRIRVQSVGAKPVLKRPAGVPAGVSAPAPAPKAAMQTKITQPGAKPATKPAAVKPDAFKARTGVPERTQAIAFPAAKKMAEPSPVVSSPAHEKTQEELAEADSIIEEAELYAIHGHPDRAILILKELLQQHATKTEAWMLLFSIYSSLKKTAEFEKAAQDFMGFNKDSTLWPEIQALGRWIDPGNILYADFSVPAPAPKPVFGKRALLGDILLAMGALTIKDMENCLAEFDPKVDGRFGGFLIKRNMITEAQLDGALLQQQLNNEANTCQVKDAPKAEKPPEQKNEMPAVLEFEPPAIDLPKMTQSPGSDQTPGTKPGSV